MDAEKFSSLVIGQVHRQSQAFIENVVRSKITCKLCDNM